jgi:membrane protein
VRAPDLDLLRKRLESSFLGRCVGSFVRLQGLDRSVVIASQAFTTLIPLLILVSALLPVGNQDLVADAIIRKLGLSGEGADAVRTVFAQSQSGSIGFLSVVIMLFSGVSLTRRLQRMYLEAWRLPPRSGVHGRVSAALGLLALVAEIIALYAIRSLTRSLPGGWGLGLPFSVATSLALWTSVPWLLLDRRVGWRRLLPGALLTGVAASLYAVATSIYMPPLVEVYSERYGLFGVTIALVGWLLCISFIVVSATVVAAELDRAPERWARAVRSRLMPHGGGGPAAQG